LAEATGRGRIEEFEGYGWNVDQMIDPQDPEAFAGAKLRWTEVGEPEHAQMLGLYRRLIALRATEPDLSAGDLTAVDVRYNDAAGWVVLSRGTLRVVVNLAAEPQKVPVGGVTEIVLTTGELEVGNGAMELAAETATIV